MLKYFSAIAVFIMYGSLACAADFSWSFLETPESKHSRKDNTALFDGAVTGNKSRVVWTGESSAKGCGVLVELNSPMPLCRIKVFTAKPGQAQMIPSKTEFYRWNDKTQSWEEPQIIEDVTGRATDKKFTSKAVNTEWKVSTAPIRAFKILMYGEGICLTEIKILCTTVNGQEKQLIPNSQPDKIENGKVIKKSSSCGGSSKHLQHWSPTLAYAGNPNLLNRSDRVVFNFDLREYLNAGRVERAVLALPLQPFGVLEGNMVEIEVFSKEHNPVYNMDITAHDTYPLAAMLIDRKSQTNHSFDVTAVVNRALYFGEGGVTFRVRNVTTEMVGNRKHKAEGVLVDMNKLQLKIIE